MLHFCLRGREGLCQLKKSSALRTNDSHGRVYITLAFSELEKKHQGFDKHDDPGKADYFVATRSKCVVQL